MGASTLGFGDFVQTAKIQRRPKNPMDKCTLVSVYPNSIVDFKHTAFPQKHYIEGAADNDFSITVLEGASWYKMMEEGQPTLEIGIPSSEVARAFVQDFISGLPEYVPEVASPGLFYCYGEYDKKTILKYVSPEGVEFKDLLAKARERQKQWFLRIIQMSDKDWARTNGNPRSVGDTARMAAEKLGITGKAWMQDFVAIQKSPCKACGTFIDPIYPVCPNCKTVVNVEKFKELGLQFAS